MFFNLEAASFSAIFLAFRESRSSDESAAASSLFEAVAPDCLKISLQFVLGFVPTRGGVRNV